MLAATHDIDSGIRKAAILVASLEPAMADILLDQLSSECADRVRQAVMVIDWIDADEQQRVIDEFRRIELMIPDQCPSGIDLGNIISHPSRSSREAIPLTVAVQPEEPIAMPAAAMPEGAVRAEASKPFEFLLQTEDEKLTQVLASERPQTIAVVLSHLPADRAGNVLMQLTIPLQTEVVRRLVDLGSADPETIREIEQAILARLSQQLEETPSPAGPNGPETVSRILAACSPEMANRILENLANFDAPLAEQLGRNPVRFESLDELDDATLLHVIRSADPETIVAALLGATPILVARLLRRMAPEQAKSLKRKLNCPGPIQLRDIEEARRRLLALAERFVNSDCRRMAGAA